MTQHDSDFTDNTEIRTVAGGGGLGVGLANRLPVRHAPPHPLGHNARCFPCALVLALVCD